MEDKMKEQLLNVKNNIQETITKIDELIEDLENTYYYKIVCSINYDLYYINLQRTEFSKTKHINFTPAWMVAGEYNLLNTYMYDNGEYDDEMYYAYEYNKIELINELTILKSKVELSLLNFYNIFEQFGYDDFVEGMKKNKKERKEKEIKPSGNPFAGEIWKDRKHQFKGGRKLC